MGSHPTVRVFTSNLVALPDEHRRDTPLGQIQTFDTEKP